MRFAFRRSVPIRIVFAKFALERLAPERSVLDKSFPIEWENYRNCLLLTTDTGLNKIPTRIYSIVDVKTWDKNKK